MPYTQATLLHERLVDVRRAGSNVSINGAQHTGSEGSVRNSNEEFQVVGLRAA